MARLYEVLFYNGWQDPPAYYLLTGVEGRSPKEALQKNLPNVIKEIRQEFSLDDDVHEQDICESLYALRSNGLVAARSILSQ